MTINVQSIIEWGVVILALRKAFQLVEMLIKSVLLIYRQNGEEVPDWFASQYKKINGNKNASTQEKHDILGHAHDSSDKHKSASVGE